MINQKISSPITGQDAILINSFPKERIVKEYQEQLSLDVRRYFTDLEKIYLFKCRETNYHFFYPLNIKGDGAFYEELQKFDWYYLNSKWEHNIAMKFISENNSVLEIGCASGNFLLNLKKKFKNLKAVGIDLNEKAISMAKNKGVNATNSTIENHAQLNQKKYDAIFAFQILEHIDDVNSFIVSCLKILKQQGKLIFSVPNNNSFIKHNEGGILNFPPHHMGLWRPKVFKKLAKYYGLKVTKIIKEPLQREHYDYFIQVQEQRLKKSPVINKIYHKLRLRFLLRIFIFLSKKLIIGHNMLAVLQKK